ncbi:MAG: glycosyltransferase [Pseudomonadota bacterium]|nr:glycosyltransferase [Pseudomonadota bacterium]
MTVLRSAAATLLRLLTGARRLAPIAALFALFPAEWKLRVSRCLLRTAVGRGSIAAASGATPGDDKEPDLPLPRVDARHAGKGVNLCGYVRGELGLGESVRAFAKALAQSGYPFSLVDYGVPTHANADDHSLDHWLASNVEYPLSVYFVNPDQMLLNRAHFEAQKRVGRYLIGYWFWELERFPAAWHDAFDLVDEVWVASEFVCCCVAAATDKPVTLMPMPIDFSSPVAIDRHRFGIPADKFVFLFTFDYHSYPQRKNPEGVIAAFRAAFPRDRKDVHLLIKTLNADRLPDAHLRVVTATAADPRIVASDAHLTREQTSALLGCADAYVSLHRSEGFGLGAAEAMGLGKPVIATGYSGNMDFMSERDARLVDFTLVDVAANAYPHWQGQQWAQPDIAQAARRMRALADDPSAAAALGAAASMRIRRQYAPSICAAAVIDRLQTIAKLRSCALT